MLIKWLISAPSHIKQVEIIFPVVGHSFMPPDRIFGNIEKVVRKRDTIVEPKEYFDIFYEFGSVINIAAPDFEVLNWRQAAKDTLKPTSSWHYKFNFPKRMILTHEGQNVFIRGEPYYLSDIGIGKPVLKKGKKFPMLILVFFL